MKESTPCYHTNFIIQGQQRIVKYPRLQICCFMGSRLHPVLLELLLTPKSSDLFRICVSPLCFIQIPIWSKQEPTMELTYLKKVEKTNKQTKIELNIIHVKMASSFIYPDDLSVSLLSCSMVEFPSHNYSQLTMVYSVNSICFI